MPAPVAIAAPLVVVAPPSEREAIVALLPLRSNVAVVLAALPPTMTATLGAASAAPSLSASVAASVCVLLSC